MNTNTIVDQWAARNLRSALEELLPNGEIEFHNDANLFKLFAKYKGVTFGILSPIQGFYQIFLSSSKGVYAGESFSDPWIALKRSINNGMSHIVDIICENVSVLESCKP